MDKQNRLTRIGEWKLSHYYQWKKGDFLGRLYKCIHIGSNRNVILVECGTGHRIVYYPKMWPKRFIEVPNP